MHERTFILPLPARLLVLLSFEIFSSSPSAGRHCHPPGTTLLSPATSVNLVKRFRRFVQHVERRRSLAFAPLRSTSVLDGPSHRCRQLPSSPSSRRRLIRLINETMPDLQIARAGSSRAKSEQCRYCSAASARAPQSDASPPYRYFEKFNGRGATHQSYVAQLFISVRFSLHFKRGGFENTGTEARANNPFLHCREYDPTKLVVGNQRVFFSVNKRAERATKLTNFQKHSMYVFYSFSFIFSDDPYT